MTIINVPGALENLEPPQRDINPSLYTRCTAMTGNGTCGTLTTHTGDGLARCPKHQPVSVGPDCLAPARYTDTCGHNPDEQPVCIGCDGEHGGPVYCAWCHGAELGREIQAATAAANDHADHWRTVAGDLAGQIEALKRTAIVAAEQAAYTRRRCDNLERGFSVAREGLEARDRRIADLEREIAALRAATDGIAYMGGRLSQRMSR